MNPRKYETHRRISQNNLCPIILHTSILPLHVFHPNWHENIEIILVVSGEATMEYDKDRFPLHPQDMIVINSEILHNITTDSSVTYYSMIIDRNFARDNGLDTTNFIFSLHPKSAELKTLFLRLVSDWHSYWDTQDIFAAARLRRDLLSLLIELCTQCGCPKEIDASYQSSTERYVAKAIHYINSCYSQPLNLDIVADYLGISKCHLARAFKKYTNSTVSRYINNTRCSIASKFLSAGMSVKETAYSCGFSTEFYFSKVYKEITGNPPSSMRESVGSNKNPASEDFIYTPM